LGGILFRDKIVEASLRLEEQGIERPGQPIVRMQVELRSG
jgi:hypothetical protein